MWRDVAVDDDFLPINSLPYNISGDILTWARQYLFDYHYSIVLTVLQYNPHYSYRNIYCCYWQYSIYLGTVAFRYVACYCSYYRHIPLTFITGIDYGVVLFVSRFDVEITDAVAVWLWSILFCLYAFSFRTLHLPLPLHILFVTGVRYVDTLLMTIRTFSRCYLEVTAHCCVVPVYLLLLITCY